MGVRVACIMELSALFYVTLFLFYNNPKFCFSESFAAYHKRTLVPNIKCQNSYNILRSTIFISHDHFCCQNHQCSAYEMNEIPSAGHIHCLNCLSCPSFDMSSDMNCQLARGRILLQKFVGQSTTMSHKPFMLISGLLQDVRVFAYSYS